MAKQKKANKPTVSFVELKKDDIIFDSINPRFAGQDINPSDPTPYGKNIDKMFSSMVEVYRSTGKLLLQPIGVKEIDGKYAVRFAYTRSMTFVTRYDDLCKELGVKELTIPAQLFDKIDESEALVENLRRTDQHFMSTAYAIYKLRQAKHTYKSLTGKLGMSINRIKGLETLPDMNTMLQQMCHDGILSERAAVELAEANELIQKAVANYIAEHDIQKVVSADEARTLMKRAMPTLHDKTPVHAFTSLDGKEYPMIIDEDWVLVEGDLMNTIYVLDEKAEARRMVDYYKMIAEQVKVWDKEKYKITCSDAYQKCKMGTHPSEIAVWSGDNQTGWLDFYVKSVELNKVKNAEGYIEQRAEELDTRTKNKIVNLKEKAKMSLMRELIDTVAGQDIEGVSMLMHQVILLAYERMNKAQLEKLDELTDGKLDIKYNSHNLADFGARELLVKMGLAILHGEYSVYQAHREFFAANDIDFNALYNEKYRAEVEAEVEKAKERNKDLLIRAEDTVDDRQAFVEDLGNIIVMGTTMTLREYLAMDKPKEDKYIKYIAKGMGMTAKGGTEIVAFRLNNAVTLIEEGLDITINDKKVVMLQLLNRLDSIAMAFDERISNAETTADEIRAEYAGILRAYCEITGRPGIEDLKLSVTPVLKAASSGEDKVRGKALVETFIETYASIIKKDFGFRFVYLKNGKKVSILG